MRVGNTQSNRSTPRRDRLDNVFRRADAHQIARFVSRQVRTGGVERVIHLLFRLAHGQTADGITGKVQPGQNPGALCPQFRVDSALHNAEKRLIRARMGGFTAFGPSVGSR